MDILGRVSRLSNNDADALLSGRPVHGHDDLRDTLDLLRASVAAPAPAPSPALVMMLDEGLSATPAAAPSPPAAWRRWSVRAAVAAAAVGTVTLGAATANALPAPLQSAVADVVDGFTPFGLPRPAAGSPQAPQPADVPAVPLPAGGVDPVAPADRDAEDDGRDDPSTVVPGPGPAGDDSSVEERPGADDSGDEPDTDQPDGDEPHTGQPGGDRPDGDRPETGVGDVPADEPAPHAPGSDQPGSDQPDSDQPDSDQPDVRQPETSPTDADDPADHPVVDQPLEDQLDSTG